MRRIAVITGTRADYGLLYNTIKRIYEDSDLELQLIVTGTHLSHDYGYTVSEIEDDGFPIAERIEVKLGCNDGRSTAGSMSELISKLSAAFERKRPDIALILGDRYEIFAAAATAMVMNIPIAHISGGEITEGAVDDQIRHSITKIAHLHFPGAQLYADNICKMGEESWRIFNFGDPGIENIKNIALLDAEELGKELNITIDRNTLLVTFHPVTLELEALEYQVTNLIEALEHLDKTTVITYPNSDPGSKYIIRELNRFAKNNKKIIMYENLGARKYLSIMKYCGAVVGNSSSGIVEAPFLKVPSVNIGSRQSGRLMADSIIQCGYKSEEIRDAVNYALSEKARSIARDTVSLYGDGNTSEGIVNTLKTIKIDDRLLKKKLIWS